MAQDQMAQGGLAATAAAPQMSDAEMQAILQEIIALLMEGVAPEELVAEGVPEELIMQAIDIIDAEMMAQDQAAAQAEAPAGLASLVGQGR